MRMKITTLVCDAIKRLQDRNGSTSKDIMNFISSEYKETSPTVKKQVVAALQRGVDHGYLQRHHGHYTLNSAAFPVTGFEVKERSMCKPKRRKRRRSRSRSKCGPIKKRRCPRPKSKCSSRRSKSRRKSRRRKSCKPKRLSCLKPRRRRRMKCAPLSAKDSRSYNPDDKVTKAKTPVLIEEIFEHDVKPTIRPSESKHPSRSGSKAPSKRGSRAPSNDCERSRSSNWSNQDD